MIQCMVPREMPVCNCTSSHWSLNAKYDLMTTHRPTAHHMLAKIVPCAFSYPPMCPWKVVCICKTWWIYFRAHAEQKHQASKNIGWVLLVYNVMQIWVNEQVIKNSTTSVGINSSRVRRSTYSLKVILALKTFSFLKEGSIVIKWNIHQASIFLL